MVSAGLSGLSGAYLVTARAVADWVPLTQAVCRSVAGSACSPPVYRSMLYEAGVTAVAIVVMIAGIAVIGYLYDVEAFYRFPPHLPMSIPRDAGTMSRA